MSLLYRSTRPAAPTISQVATTSGNSGDIAVDTFDQLAIDINISAVSGTTPSATFTWNRKGSDGVYYPIWTSSAQTAAGKVSASIGMGGPTNHSIGQTGRLDWAITGTTPSFTFTASVIGK